MTGDFALNATAPRVMLSNGRSVADPFFNVAYPRALKNDVNMLKADDSHLVNIRLQRSVDAAQRQQGRVQRRRLQPVQHGGRDRLPVGGRPIVDLRATDELRAGAGRPDRHSDDVLAAGRSAAVASRWG